MSQTDASHSGWEWARVAAAVLGGYAISSAWVVLCGAMSQSRVEAIVGGMQSSWLWYVAAVIWASPGLTATDMGRAEHSDILMLAAAAALFFLKGR
jgi:hypothetical protein